LREEIPGAMSSASLKSRRDVTGASRSRSPWMVSVLVGFSVSSIGESAVTFTVSDKVPTFKSISTLNVAPARITIPSRWYLEKPCSSATTT
jgi:hypothetical protein